MKKLFLSLFIITYTSLSAQQSNLSYGNELKVNLGWFIIEGSVEVSYEHFLNQESSLGATVFFDDDSTDDLGDFGIGPNFRVYFGDGYANGLFGEVFGLYYTKEYLMGITTEKTSNLALGIGLGYKWLTRSNNFSLEVYGGGGRNLNPEDFQKDFIGRAALSIGFRF